MAGLAPGHLFASGRHSARHHCVARIANPAEVRLCSTVVLLGLLSAAAMARPALAQQSGAPLVKRVRTSILEIAYEESGPATGVPVLLTSTPAQAALAQDLGRAAFVYEPGDVEGLGEQLARLPVDRSAIRDAKIAAITGRAAEPAGKRKRTSSAEMKSLIFGTISKDRGLTQMEIARNTKLPYGSVVAFLKKNQKEFKITGKRKQKRYFLK